MARREGRSTDELLLLYVLERFLYRVSRWRYADKLVLKGGVLLAVLGARRATRDADLLALQLGDDQEDVMAWVAEIVSIDVDDGVVFAIELARAQPIRDDHAHAGVRVIVPAQVGKARVKLALDVSFGDPITPDAIQTRFPQLLGRETFPLLGYPIATVLAEKIVTMVVLGDLNTRDRDWADTWRLTGIHDLDGVVMRQALNRTASYRGVRLCALSDVIGQLPQLRQGPYAAWRRRQTAEPGAYPQSFAQVVQSVVSFADPLLTGQTDGQVWDAAVRNWRPDPTADAADTQHRW